MAMLILLTRVARCSLKKPFGIFGHRYDRQTYFYHLQTRTLVQLNHIGLVSINDQSIVSLTISNYNNVEDLRGGY